MRELIIPAAFAEQTADREGAAGEAWLAELPGLADRYCRAWSLEPDGDPLHGFVGLILPVRRADGTRAMLKLSWLDEDTRDEPVALSTWNGDGAVLLLESDPARGAMLLERLDSGRMLQTEPIGDAVRVAAGLLRRLCVPAPPGLTCDLRAEAARLVEELPRDWKELGEPFPRRLVDAAVEVCRDLGPSADRLMVNEDLHYENVLAGTREPWLVIDPKPVVGDPEWGTISLLWNRFEESTVDDRFAAVVAGAELDAGRARAWTLVRAVQNWLWYLEDDEDPDEFEDSDDPAFQAAPHLARWAAASY
ncbi:aminoglycoside phosphotransferase family protein [Amycolatopsis anabasis]|uniref:aminoglycoside phosphotransferase family protein n=1 Tax=Amycolatopsis anabasis TaxID=1840409 RepID=UPI00131C21C3|nr:aminoglycoside phosphotransferase family protein [Amycolatopsis anabasis]